MTTNGSETSWDSRRMAEASEFGKTYGMNVDLYLPIMDVYQGAKEAAVAAGFTNTQAIVAAVDAAKVFEDWKDAAREGRDDG